MNMIKNHFKLKFRFILIGAKIYITNPDFKKMQFVFKVAGPKHMHGRVHVKHKRAYTCIAKVYTIYGRVHANLKTRK